MDWQDDKTTRALAEKLRMRRLVRNLVWAASNTIYIAGVSALIRPADHAAFAELVHGFSDLITALNKDISGLSDSAGTIFGCIGFFAFSCTAIWISQRFTGAVRVVVLIQLAVLSLLYQLVGFQFFRAEGRPLSTVIAIAVSLGVGIFLRKRDTERRELDAKQIEIKLRNDELQESRLALVKQDESERRLLAADLHDQVLNDLRSIQKKFESYVKEPSNESKDAINSLLKTTMSDIREIMDELCPVLLEEFGLGAAIEDRLDKASKQAGFQVRFNQSASSDTLDRLTAVEKQLLYRLVQESLNNVSKHAAANVVRVNIDETDSQIFLRISDDGKGIDPSKLSESSRGTLYMRLRAALIGAKVSWKPGPDGKGTTVEIRANVQNTGS